MCVISINQRFVIIGCLILLCSSTRIYAQSLKIQVSDAKTNARIEYANITWRSLEPEAYINGTVTDKNGIAHFSVGEAKLIHITVSYIGYKNFSDTISSQLGKYNVKLSPATLSLQEVVINGKTKEQVLRESPEAVSVISMRELQGRSVSLESILDKTVGLKIERSGGMGSSSRIILHGLEGKRIQILWDGLPININEGIFSLDEIPIDIIDRIEVYKSIIPARFGCDGLSGAINIVSKEFSTDYLDISYERSTFNTNKANLFSRKNFKKSGILLGFGTFYTSSDNDYEFTVPERENLRIKRDHDRFRSYMLKGRIALAKLWFNEINAELGYYNRFNEIQGVLKNIQHAENSAGTFILENKIVKKGLLKNKLDFDSQLSISNLSNNFTDTSSVSYDFEGNIFPSPNGRGETGYLPHNTDDKYLDINERINFDYHLTKDHNLNFNTLYHYSKKSLKDSIASEHAGFVIGGYPSSLSSFVSGLSLESKFYDQKVNNMLSVKVFHLNSSIEDLTSYEMIEAPKQRQNIMSQFAWIEAIKYEVIPNIHLKASYQRAVRLPRAQELFGDGIIVFPSVNLRPEKSHNFNAGLLIDKNRILGLYRVQFELGGYYMNVSDMIKLVHQYRASGFINAEHVIIKGLEAELKLDFTPSIYVYGNLTCQDARDMLKNISNTNTPNPTYKLKMPNIPNFYANFGAEYHTNSLLGKNWFVKVFWDSKFAEEYFYFWEMTKFEKRRIPRTWINDAGVVFTFKRQLSIAAECHNFANIENWDQYRQPLPGRVLLLKLRYTFSKNI